MTTLETSLLILQVIIAVCLIGFILIQHGKGADAGAAFGSGASSTVFGSSGSGNFLTRSTTLLAILFLSNSLFLAYLAAHRSEPKSLMEDSSIIVIEEPIEVPTDFYETDPVTSDSDVPTLPE